LITLRDQSSVRWPRRIRLIARNPRPARRRPHSRGLAMHAERACGIIRPRRLFAQPSTPSEHDGSMIVDDKDHPRNA
jgi:hypothetical protein